ncbi:hypothetical protein Q0Z83_016630 [Actinoplanes sichuanensis]|uniref:Uncharacterized protein n=1 Tax=Actinoplanes sichuanensis TaxID=512349 RepID=A0ABW4A6S7_9ACTN|nr:hypothetical protein [Actinoplanes sichuanensis]BEL03472.1 hypothetical protein Q0Z83_016630 [Actinoplanes sichuanensis]
MADEMRGVVFGGPLERLRQAARVDLPRLADEYAQIRNACETTKGYDDRMDRPAYFGSPALKGVWVQLRDVLWSAAGETGKNLWELSLGLDAAVNRFAYEDTVAGDEMRRIQGRLQSDRSPANDEWTVGYDSGPYPE